MLKPGSQAANLQQINLYHKVSRDIGQPIIVSDHTDVFINSHQYYSYQKETVIAENAASLVEDSMRVRTLPGIKLI